MIEESMIPVHEALQERLAEYRNLCLSCEPADRETFEEVAREIHAIQGHKPLPKNRVVWFQNPLEMAGVVLALNKSCVPRAKNVADEVFERELQYAREHPIAPPMWDHGVSAYFLGGGLSYPKLAWRSFRKDLEVSPGMFEAYAKTVKSAGPWDLNFNYIAVCECPLSVVGEVPPTGIPYRNAYLHNERGPAIVWRGGPNVPELAVYLWHGQRVTAQGFKKPSKNKSSEVGPIRGVGVNRGQNERQAGCHKGFSNKTNKARSQDIMGVKKVTELTEEQKAMMPVWAEKWTKIGLSCEPADRETWVEGARGCYKSIGHELPKVIWFANPRTLVKTCPTLATAYDLIGEKVVTSEEEFDGYVKQAMTMESKYSWSDYIGGQFWAAWVAFETFFREVVELEYEGDLAEKAEAYAKTVKSAGWWWPHVKFVGVSERPKEIHLEDAGNQKRLHCGNGPAISWRATDDEEEFGIYFWHGVNVPKDWIMNPKTCSVQEILKEENVEKRRAGCEIISWDRILAETPHRVIDEDADPEIGTLVAMDLPDSPNEYFLRVRCGTGRSFALCVPNQAAPGVPMKTAKQANAWTYGLDQDELHPEVRT